MKRKLLISVLALVSAALLPLAATCQIAPDRPPRTDTGEKNTKYEIFAGYGYTSLNQVNQSRNGLQGVSLSVTRDWGKYFGLTADGGYYKYPYDAVNPGDPSVEMILLGPVIHGHLFTHYDAFFHVLLGGEHTGGESMTPSVSFAGGFGGGLDYQLSPHFSLRLYGDDIISSFSLAGNTPALAYSPHRSRNSRASLGVVYKF